MKKLILPVLIFTVLLSSCKNPFEAKDKGIEQLNNIEKEWDDAVNLASSTARIALPTPVANLQSIKRNSETIEVGECLKPVKKILNHYMGMKINTFLKFMAENESTKEEQILEKAKISKTFKEYLVSKSKCTGEINPKLESTVEEKAAEAMLEAKATVAKTAQITGLDIELIDAVAEAEAYASLVDSSLTGVEEVEAIAKAKVKAAEKLAIEFKK